VNTFSNINKIKDIQIKVVLFHNTKDNQFQNRHSEHYYISKNKVNVC